MSIQKEKIMSAVEIIIHLMKEKNITAYQLTLACGLSNSAVTDWKSGKAKPSADALSKIADYFNVSVDYLLNRVPTPTPTYTLPDDMKDIQFAFHGGAEGLTQDDIDDIREFVEFKRAQRNKDKQ